MIDDITHNPQRSAKDMHARVQQLHEELDKAPEKVAAAKRRLDAISKKRKQVLDDRYRGLIEDADLVALLETNKREQKTAQAEYEAALEEATNANTIIDEAEAFLMVADWPISDGYYKDGQPVAADYPYLISKIIKRIAVEPNGDLAFETPALSTTSLPLPCSNYNVTWRLVSVA